MNLKNVFVDPLRKKALIYLLLIEAVFYLFKLDQINDPGFVFSVVGYTIYAALGVAVLAYVRYPRDIGSVWGYIWRIFASSIIGSVPAVLVLMWVFQIRAADKSSLVLMLACVLNVVMSLLVMWILFSSDRKGQVTALLKKICGY